MNLVLIGVLGVVIMLALVLMGVNIGLAMALVGFAGIICTSGFKAALSTVGSIPFSQSSSYSMSVIPLFVLMGQLSLYSGLSSGLFGAADKWLGHIKGGLSIATIAACAFFAAICGSTTATCVTMATLALPEMKKAGYKDSLSTGCLAAGGTLGVLIPPSTIFVIYKFGEFLFN